LSITVFYEILKDNPSEKKLNDNSHNTKLWCNTGFKMIPLNMSENLKCFNLKYKPWREYFAINKMSDLVINCITPGVPLFATYYYIMNSKKNLYDNKTQYLRLKNSEIAQEILKSLHEAQKGTYWVTGSNKKTDKKIKSWISNKFKKLDEKIQTPIEYATDEIIMSDASLMFIVEHVGVTFSNVFVFLEKSKTFHQKYGALLTDSGYHVFAKYIFNICYTLMTLNIKLGIIHGDLHLNNVTLNKKNLNTEENSYVIYNLNIAKYKDIINVINSYSNNNVDNIDNTENYTFILPHLGTHPCIIDFSRSFILLKLISENIIEKEKNNIRTKFIKMEQQRIMTELKKIFPNFLKNNAHKIKFLFKNKNFNILFIYFSAFDIFKFSSNLLIFINKFSIQNDIIVNPEILQLLDNISKKAYSYLEKIIDEESYVNSEDIKFPNLEILLEFFSSFKVDSTKSVKNKINKHAITDIFSIDNIESYLNINDIINEINLNLSENLNLHTNKKTLDIINNKIKSFINYTHVNDDLEIEYLINKEYYKIKNNLSFITTNNFTSGTVSESDFSIYNF
jgi:hypothetical protein